MGSLHKEGLFSYIKNKFSKSDIQDEKTVDDEIKEDVEYKVEGDLEIAAVISAAISMYTNLSSNKFKIKSIVRTRDNYTWRRA